MLRARQRLAMKPDCRWIFDSFSMCARVWICVNDLLQFDSYREDRIHAYGACPLLSPVYIVAAAVIVVVVIATTSPHRL